MIQQITPDWSAEKNAGPNKIWQISIAQETFPTFWSILLTDATLRSQCKMIKNGLPQKNYPQENNWRLVKTFQFWLALVEKAYRAIHFGFLLNNNTEMPKFWCQQAPQKLAKSINEEMPTKGHMTNLHSTRNMDLEVWNSTFGSMF